jgi:hypothetical protein
LYSAVKKAVKQASAFLLVQTNDKQLSYSRKKNEKPTMKGPLAGQPPANKGEGLGVHPEAWP